jgi:hypothetical protein
MACQGRTRRKKAGAIRRTATYTVRLIAAGNADDGGAGSTCTAGHVHTAFHPRTPAPTDPRTARRIARRRARLLVAPAHLRRSSWTAPCPAGRTAVIVSRGSTDSLGRTKHARARITARCGRTRRGWTVNARERLTCGQTRQTAAPRTMTRQQMTLAVDDRLHPSAPMAAEL